MRKKFISGIACFAVLTAIQSIIISTTNNDSSMMLYLSGYLVSSLVIGLFYYTEYYNMSDPVDLIGRCFKFDGGRWQFTGYSITDTATDGLIVKYTYKSLDDDSTGYFYSDQLDMLFGDHSFSFM